MRRLATTGSAFAEAFARLVDDRRESSSDVSEAVAGIIARVRRDGDAALGEFTRRFDELDLAVAGIAVEPSEVEEAWRACGRDQLAALEQAAERIRAFHAHQMPRDIEHDDALGVRLGLRWSPIDAVGLYVPGGLAAYPSSVLMNAVPAAVAGVGRIVMTVPTPRGEVQPLVLAAARIAGVGEIYRLGGAQAVAALAFGTETVRPVDKIVGPGNAYVAEAKRQVFGRVGIDMIAGPSEVVVVADDSGDPEWLAADLLSQAEHDASAQAILITDSRRIADEVVAAVERQLAGLRRREVAAASWREHGAVIVCRDLAEAVGLVDRLAPEHLELVVAEPGGLARRIRHAGAIFLGRWTPEVIGDYVGGPNHVLPTGRSARFSSGLGVVDFLKRTTILGCSEASFRALAPAAATLAHAEGLEAHARAIERRLEAIA